MAKKIDLSKMRKKFVKELEQAHHHRVGKNWASRLYGGHYLVYEQYGHEVRVTIRQEEVRVDIQFGTEGNSQPFAMELPNNGDVEGLVDKITKWAHWVYAAYKGKEE